MGKKKAKAAAKTALVARELWSLIDWNDWRSWFVLGCFISFVVWFVRLLIKLCSSDPIPENDDQFNEEIVQTALETGSLHKRYKKFHLTPVDDKVKRVGDCNETIIPDCRAVYHPNYLAVEREIASRVREAIRGMDADAVFPGVQTLLRSDGVGFNLAMLGDQLKNPIMTVALLVPLKPVFKTMAHGMIPFALRSVGCPDDLKALATGLYNGSSYTAGTNGSTAKGASFDRGIKPASPLAPLLTAVTNNTLVRVFGSGRGSCPCPLHNCFAVISVNLKALQESVGVFSEFLKEAKVKVDTKEWLLCSRGDAKEDAIKLKFNEKSARCKGVTIGEFIDAAKALGSDETPWCMPQDDSTGAATAASGLNGLVDENGDITNMHKVDEMLGREDIHIDGVDTTDDDVDDDDDDDDDDI